MANITMIPDASDGDIARWLAERLNAAIAAAPKGAQVAITVPGGSTPFPIFAELAKLPIDFTRLVIWPGDDRIVPEDHPASNLGRLRKALAGTGAHIPALAEGAVPPAFALAWLGMGEDGHIASLFPNTDPRPDEPAKILRLTPDPLPPEAPFDRITLTMPVLAGAEALMFVFRGAEKRAVFDAAAQGASDTPVARLLKATAAPVTVFC